MFVTRLKRNRAVGFSLLILFALYWCGITLFTHSHVVNGVVVVHSHPYKAGHTHTQEQFETIFYLSLLQISGDIQSCMDLSLWFMPLYIIVFTCASVLPAPSLAVNGSRAPPFFPF